MPADTSDESKEKAKASAPKPVERTHQSHHTVTIDGQELSYTATAGTIFIRDEKDEPRAELFYVAYTRDVEDPSTRPVTFAFNGGPGSSAVWLHLGTFGPRRVEAGDAGPSAAAPHRLTNNEASILDESDLVFIDPVGTGWSRPLGDHKADEFFSLKNDVESVAEVIQRWTSRSGRWSSPRYLAGESYGATRAASLTAHLTNLGMVVNGVVLLSPALLFSTIIFETNNDLPHVLYLPGYAATAAYHGKASTDDPQALRREVEVFAIEKYAPALLLGAALPDSRRQSLAEELSRFTGLPAKLWLRHDLRIDLSRFCRELLLDEGEIVGRLDSRFRGLLSQDKDDPTEDDPALFYPYGPFASAIQDYLRRDLGVEEDRRYEVISFDVNQSWKWATDEKKLEGHIDVAADLRRAMIQSPNLRVLFCNGIYDLATPYFASMHTARHLGREPTIQQRISEAFYDAGHMMYLHAPSRAQLRQDLVALLRG